MNFFGVHNHTQYSNLRLRDCIIKEKDLIKTSAELGYKGVVITDHEALSSHVKAHKAYKQMKENGELPKDYKLAFGNEIYLIDDNKKEDIANNKYVKYTHFILIAKNKNGYDGISELSSIANSNSFMNKGMERVPTFKSDLVRVMKKYKGDIIASTACLGGELATDLDNYIVYKDERYKKKAVKFVRALQEIFGEENVFIEIHPTLLEQGKRVNSLLYKVAEFTKATPITATDSHYLLKEHAKIHETYLKASDGDREVAMFYATTYLHTRDEFQEEFTEFTTQTVDALIENTMKVYDLIEEFEFAASPQIPVAKIEVDYSKKAIFKPYINQYKYIKKFFEDTEKANQDLINLCGEGFIILNQELNDENLSRLNTELEVIDKVTAKLGQNLSEYFLSMYHLIQIAWQKSIVGPGRGSGVAWYINYLLEITQLNPIKNGLPYWRFLTPERAEMPDIDVDTESSKKHLVRDSIREIYPNSYGIATFLTEKPNAAIMTISRALGEEVIKLDEAKYLSSLFPKKKCETIQEALDLYGKDSECSQFINEINKYEGMLDLILYIEGLVCGKGVHPAGMIILEDDYYKYLPIMKSKGGELVTQHDLHDSEYRGGLKYDLLVLKTLDEIRTGLDLLINNNKIENKGSLRDNYYNYLHPDVLEYEDRNMWNLLHEQRVIDVFQFDGNVGAQALKKVKPYNLLEAIVANTLMRISVDEGEQPIDRYIRFKNDISLWYKEMADFGLSVDHIKTLEPHLLHLSGVADTQEAAMKLSMDPKIGDFDIAQAHKLRKAIAKSYAKDQLEQIKKLFYLNTERGVDKVLLDYVWEMQFKPMFDYSFSQPHVAAYTVIAIQQANICYRYGELYWKAAVLTTNSTDYSSTAVALAKLKGFALPPDINEAERGFKIVEDREKCLFGLNSIMKIGADLINEILANRPYTSVEDFRSKIKIGNDKMINLIKAGCFDGLNRNRRQLMMDFVKSVVPQRTNLTTANIPMLIKNDLIPADLKDEVNIWSFRKELLDKKNLYKAINKTQGYYKINESKVDKNMLLALDDIEYLDNNEIGINSKEFDNYYKNKTVRLTEWLKTDEPKDKLTAKERNDMWAKYCSGNELRWEMNAVNLYYDKHEIDVIPLDKYFTLEDFNELPENPIVTNVKMNKGRKVEEYKLSVIAGAVIDKDKDKKYIELSTPTGAVMVRLGGKYNHYHKSVPGDPSWFERGSLLIVVGFRMGDNFIAKTYKDSIYKHSVMKIDSYNSTNVRIKMDKKIEE